MTAISWTNVTWNPTTGCTKVSSGCKHCYAETMSRRVHAMNPALYANGFDFEVHPSRFDQPRRWRKPRRIFVGSMSDLFHEENTREVLRKLFDVMLSTPRHTYQILTKRPDRMARFIDDLTVEGIWTAPPHIWLGTSVEDARVLHRVEQLRAVTSAVRFLSCEPLLGPLVELDLSGIHWVIVGGESGAHLQDDRKAGRRSLAIRSDKGWTLRYDRLQWVRDIRDACTAENVAFHFKQWGGFRPKSAGRMLDGRIWDEMPDERRTNR